MVFLAGSASCTLLLTSKPPRCRVSTPQQQCNTHAYTCTSMHHPSPPTSSSPPLAWWRTGALLNAHYGSCKTRQDNPTQHHRRPLGSCSTQGRKRQGGVSETHQPGSEGLTEPTQRSSGTSRCPDPPRWSCAHQLPNVGLVTRQGSSAVSSLAEGRPKRPRRDARAHGLS